jgi:two-component system, OmpR family, KDP operon response regulator KdpE
VALLLLIEDDPEIRRALIHALSERGHTIRTASTGMSGLHDAIATRPDLVILDLGLPDTDGRTVLRMLRSVSRVPVIVATARDDEPSIVEVLELGADDHVGKPFGAAQLDARIRAVLRRGVTEATRADAPLVVGDLVLRPAAREVTLAGNPVELTAREFDLLSYLANRVGAVVTRRELLTEVWHQPYHASDRTVDVHLSWLRRKLGESAREPRYLHTVRGVGVKLTVPEDAPADPLR